jgi:tetratricopeptide (TPR) repeat protein
VDDGIGRVLGKLRELGLYDSSLIVVVGDHGEMLGEHREADHGYFIYQSAIRVPMIFKLAGQTRSREVQPLAGIVDVTPTVCAILGVPVPAGIQVQDLSPWLRGRSSGPRDRSLYCESLTPTRYGARPLLGLVSDRWKYIDTTQLELYDLTRDPGETNNLARQEPQRALAMQRTLKDMLGRVDRDGSTGKIQLDEQSIERLQSLGYVGGHPQEDAGSGQNQDDAKDLIDFHTDFESTFELLFRKRYDEAEKILRKLAAQRPQFYEPRLSLGKISLARNDFPAAVSNYQAVLDLQPADGHEAHYGLGVALSRMGRYDQAIREYDASFAMSPDPGKIHAGIGWCLAQQGKWDESITHDQKALELDPDSALAHDALARAYAATGHRAEALASAEKALALARRTGQIDLATGVEGFIATLESSVNTEAETHKTTTK